jgi:hypothetical protein
MAFLFGFCPKAPWRGRCAAGRARAKPAEPGRCAPRDGPLRCTTRQWHGGRMSRRPGLLPREAGLRPRPRGVFRRCRCARRCIAIDSWVRAGGRSANQSVLRAQADFSGTGRFGVRMTGSPCLPCLSLLGVRTAIASPWRPFAYCLRGPVRVARPGSGVSRGASASIPRNRRCTSRRCHFVPPTRACPRPRARSTRRASYRPGQAQQFSNTGRFLSISASESNRM